jgi:hypothetical protein
VSLDFSLSSSDWFLQRNFCDRFSDTTAELEMFLWSVIAAAIPPSKRFPDAFSINPSVESTEDNPYAIDEFYCTLLLWVRPTGSRRDLVVRAISYPQELYFLTTFLVFHLQCRCHRVQRQFPNSARRACADGPRATRF